MLYGFFIEEWEYPPAHYDSPFDYNIIYYTIVDLEELLNFEFTFSDWLLLTFLTF